ncbi:MAG: ATPase [Egibacteraceae bacterium]
MDVEAYLAQMEQLLAEARPVPLSASVMVNRKDFDDVIDDLRTHLPEELRQSRWILKERDEVLEQAERESEQILSDAQAEQDRLVSEQEVVRTARREAERILEEAREQARILRLEAEDYVDGKLANFEIVLAKTMKAVEKGRERLRGRLASDELRQEVEAEPDDPYSTGEFTSAQFYDYENPQRGS